MINSTPNESPFLPVETSPAIPSRAAWSPTAIVWACLLFSVLPGGIMYALNFERLGQPQKKKTALLGVIAFCFVFYGILFAAAFKPELFPSFNEKMLRALSAAGTFGMARIFYLQQKPLFIRHLQQGGKKASVWPPIVWSVATITVVGIALVGYFIWQVNRDEQEFSRGYALMQKGKYDEAEKIFKSYQDKYPDETPAYMNLALIYADEAKLPQAKQELTELLRLDPKDKDAKDLLKDVEDELKAQSQ